MTTNTTLLWVEAGKRLAENPEDKVDCPECGQSTLTVKDISNEFDSTQFERYLTCESCDSFNILRMTCE